MADNERFSVNIARGRRLQREASHMPTKAKRRGRKTGIFADVPYGPPLQMSREMSENVEIG